MTCQKINNSINLFIHKQQPKISWISKVSLITSSLHPKMSLVATLTSSVTIFPILSSMPVSPWIQKPKLPARLLVKTLSSWSLVKLTVMGNSILNSLPVKLFLISATMILPSESTLKLPPLLFLSIGSLMRSQALSIKIRKKMTWEQEIKDL